MANNAVHSVAFVNVNEIPNIGISTQWAISSVYDPTDLQVYRNDADSLADVFVHDGNYNTGFIAYVDCPSTATTSGSHPLFACRGQRVFYDAWWYYNDIYYDTQTRRRKISCHELGHTVGLRHWDDFHGSNHSCMMSEATASSVEGISTHETGDHINSFY